MSGDETKLEFVNPIQVPDWDSRIMSYDGFTFFHGAAWAGVLTESFGFVPQYALLRQAGHIQALLPVMEVRSPFTGARGVGLPFSDLCAPLAVSPDAARVLFEHLKEHGRDRQWQHLSWRGGNPVSDAAQPSVSYHAHTLDLRPGLEVVEARCDSAVRRAIRKAQESGLTVRLGASLDALKRFHHLYCLTRQRHGLPPQPFSFFQSIHRHVICRGYGFVAEALLHHTAIASAVFFTLGRRALYKYGASDHTHQQTRANNLVMWEAIQWLIKKGCESLHMGRTSLANEGLRRFKLGWGTDESRLDYFKCDLRENTFVREQDDAQGWHNRVFRLLPVPASRLVGALAYKHAG